MRLKSKKNGGYFYPILYFQQANQHNKISIFRYIPTKNNELRI